VQRSVDRWLDLALASAAAAERRPARLFARLDEIFHDTIKWEAQVPFVVTFACLALCDYDPLPALQLSIEWGHDTDSYASLVGAFVGALHGVELFPAELGQAVVTRLRADYDEDVGAWARLLGEWRWA
jgi:ADP-ribosylglycohydrolase